MRRVELCVHWRFIIVRVGLVGRSIPSGKCPSRTHVESPNNATDRHVAIITSELRNHSFHRVGGMNKMTHVQKSLQSTQAHCTSSRANQVRVYGKRISALCFCCFSKRTRRSTFDALEYLWNMAGMFSHYAIEPNSQFCALCLENSTC